jgi:hypothetical protein
MSCSDQHESCFLWVLSKWPEIGQRQEEQRRLVAPWRGLERRHLVTLQRQRHQSWRVDRGKDAGAAPGQRLERLVVESREQWGHSLIERVHAGELLNRSARLLSRLCSTIPPKNRICTCSKIPHPPNLLPQRIPISQPGTSFPAPHFFPRFLTKTCSAGRRRVYPKRTLRTIQTYQKIIIFM